MKPTHRSRLPVSKPRFVRQNNDDVGGLARSESHPSNSSERQRASLVSPSTAGVHDVDSRQAVPPAAGRLRSPIKRGPFTARPAGFVPAEFRSEVPLARSIVSEVIEIEVENESIRPFELGDLLTREFAARNSGFLISLAFHTLVLLLLSLVLIHSTGKALIMLELLSSPDVEQYEGIIAEVDVNIDDQEELIAAVDQDPFNAAFGDSNGDQTVVDVSQITGTEGGGKKTKGQGDGKSAKFFGMRAMGNKFVYVLDRSGSMAYESSDVNEYHVSRFDVARMELMNSVESLRPHQEFYVVLFSTGMQSMFNNRELIPTPIKATPENKARLKEWLWREQANGGTDPRGSLKLAFKMDPDAIFMLSDGEFRDERKDGNPLSIEIARQQIAEHTPIRINSIALEDDASKVNMEELSAVSGGQFKFVKVKDYLSQMASSPAEFFRTRVPVQSQIQLAVSWTERAELAKKLIRLLDVKTQSDRRDAELRLHEFSFGIFESVIPSVAASEFDPDVSAKAIKEWKEAWSIATDQTDLDPSTPIGLFSTLATVGNKDFLASVEPLSASSFSPQDQISVTRGILDFQRTSGQATEQSRTLLLRFLRELNKQSTAEFNEERFLKSATLATCQRRLDTVLKNRRLRASRLYGQTKNRRLLAEARLELAKDLIAYYPETKVAKQAAEQLDLPVSVRNETE